MFGFYIPRCLARDVDFEGVSAMLGQNKQIASRDSLCKTGQNLVILQKNSKSVQVTLRKPKKHGTFILRFDDSCTWQT